MCRPIRFLSLPVNFILHQPPSFSLSSPRQLNHLIQGWKLPQEMTRALIPPGISIQIPLVIILRIPPLPRGQNLRNDLPLPPLLIHFLGNVPRDLFLLCVVVENPGPVLRAGIWSLAVGCRGVVHAVEELEELAVVETGGVVGYLESFGIC